MFQKQGAFVSTLVLSAAIAAGSAGCSSKAATAAAPSTGPYPAVKPDIGQIVDHGGARLAAAKIVTVTWAVDLNAAALEDFGDKLGGSAYWKDALAGYSIANGTSGPANHVRITTAPPQTIEVVDLETWIGEQVQKAQASGWPAWDANTTYVVYVPTATRLTSGGEDTCSLHASLHSEIPTNAQAISYVLIDESCNGSRSVLDAATSSAAHEILEAATNPFPFSSQAIIGFDPAHLAWGLEGDAPDAEIGDICEGLADAVFTGPADLPYALQRIWSNASAAAGHSPCVPQSAEPYFNVTPLAQETLDVHVGVARTPATGLGYRVSVGTKKTFRVAYYSDAPTGLWNLSAVEGNGRSAPSATHAALSVAVGTGANGQTDEVTIDVTSAPDAGDTLLVTLVSSAEGHTTHYFPILIGTN